MKKIFFGLIVLFAIQSCNNSHDIPPNLTPVYENPKNMREAQNLYGNVKSLKQFKALVNNNDFEKAEPEFYFQFTPFGEFEEDIYYQGNDIHKNIYEYDTQNRLIKSVGSGSPADLNFILTIDYDTINRTETYKYWQNNEVIQQLKIVYDENKNISKQISIEAGDTVVFFRKNVIENDKVLSEIDYEKDPENPAQESHYQYNKKGNRISQTVKDVTSEYQTETVWENQKITHQKNYVIAPGQEKKLESVSVFNEIFNPINKKIYIDGKLNTEIKYQYKYDNHGNWIEKTTWQKEHWNKDEVFVLHFRQTREITYWE